MRNPPSILENDTEKLRWDFDIRTDHLISARKPDLIITGEMGICKIIDFAVPTDYRIKLKGCEKNDKNLNLAMKLKKNYGTWQW